MEEEKASPETRAPLLPAHRPMHRLSTAPWFTELTTEPLPAKPPIYTSQPISCSLS